MSLDRLAPWAAAVIAAAFAMHNLNGAVIEPRLLGFGSYADYADLAKLQAASRAWPWLLSGLGHVASGFAVVVLGLATYRRYAGRYPEAALVAAAAALLAGAGFLLVGISHVIGRQTLMLLADANPPALRDAAYTAATVVRIWVNALAQIGLGWFAVQLAWCGRRSGELSRGFVAFSFVSGACGLLMAVAYIPIYLYTVLLWSVWLAVSWRRRGA
ncbi:MAG: hypothetical protein JNM50_07135 [Chromatiales bacterium]|jgi:hypothetical protein|nr:hypothetical protein [Chromatiales bacterium]